MMRLQTPFYSKHLEYGCQWIERPGYLWYAPDVYTSVEEECRMVRERAGFVDYSTNYMFAAVGRDSFGFLQRILANDLRKITIGKAIYTAILDEAGRIIDNTTLFWLKDNFFLLNGVGTREQRVYEWLRENAQGLDVNIIKMGKGMLALQGPKSRDILQKAMNVKDLYYYSLKTSKINGIPVLIARLGYTGELGYELYVYPEYGIDLWNTVIELGKEFGVGPYGYTAGRILALEKGYISSADFYEGSTPLELGLAWAVAFDKDDFIGKRALLQRRSEGLKTKLLGFEVSDPGVVASGGDNLVKENKVVGQVTRGAYSFSLEKSIGRSWVESRYAKEENELSLQHGGKTTKIKLVRGRWYDPENKKIKK